MISPELFEMYIVYEDETLSNLKFQHKNLHVCMNIISY